MFQSRYFNYRMYAGAALITAWLLFGAPSVSDAAYSVEPLMVEVQAEARDIISRSITITNTGPSVATLYPTVNNISLDEGGTIHEFVQAVESDRTQSLSAWIEISRLGMNIQPGETRTIPFTLRIHPAPVPGVYHALIGFGSGRNRDEAEQMVMAGNAPGTIVTVSIEDEKVEFLKLSGFVVDRFVTSADNAAATYTFKNPGSENLVPKGEIIFYDSTGKEVGSVPVNAKGISIPPQGEHVFTNTVPAEGLFGKYKAFLSVTYGTAQLANVQDTSFFYVFPLKWMLITLALIMLGVALTAWRVHHRYFDAVADDSDQLSFHVRENRSKALHHDIDLKNQP